MTDDKSTQLFERMWAFLQTLVCEEGSTPFDLMVMGESIHLAVLLGCQLSITKEEWLKLCDNSLNAVRSSLCTLEIGNEVHEDSNHVVA